MTTRKPLLLAFITCFTLTVTGQNTFNFGPELGASISRLPSDDTRIYSMDFATMTVTSKDNTLLSPVLGFSGEYISDRNILFSFGLKYQMTGTKNNGHTEFQSATEEYNTTWSVRQAFHKLSLPIGTGFRFKTGKLYSAITLGIRPNLFLSGRHHSESKKVTSIEPFEQVEESNYNPIDPDQTVIPATNMLFQYVIGVSNYVSPKIKLSLSACLGGRNYYSQGVPDPHRLAYEKYERLLNNDFEFCVTYLLK